MTEEMKADVQASRAHPKVKHDGRRETIFPGRPTAKQMKRRWLAFLRKQTRRLLELRGLEIGRRDEYNPQRSYGYGG